MEPKKENPQAALWQGRNRGALYLALTAKAFTSVFKMDSRPSCTPFPTIGLAQGTGFYLGPATASRLSVGRPLESLTLPALQGLPKAPLDRLLVVCPLLLLSPWPVSCVLHMQAHTSCLGVTAPHRTHLLTLLPSLPLNVPLSKLSLHMPLLASGCMGTCGRHPGT